MLFLKVSLLALLSCVAGQSPAPGGAFLPGAGVSGRLLEAFGQAAAVPPGTLPLAPAPTAPPQRRSPVLGPRGQLVEDTFGPPEPYQFQYSVSDAQSGAAFRQQENSNGKGIEGQYIVQLPDGRNQIVKYAATDETGFHAEVSYEGEPVFPPTPVAGGGGGGARPPGGQQPRSLPPSAAPAPSISAPPVARFDGGARLAPPLATAGNFASSGAGPATRGFGRPDGGFVPQRGSGFVGQAVASGLNGASFGSPQPAAGAFGGSARGGFGNSPPSAGLFDSAGRVPPGGDFGNSLEAPGAPAFGPTGAELTIPGGSAFGSFGGAASNVGIGGRRVAHRG